jgi:hypothetical protein
VHFLVLLVQLLLDRLAPTWRDGLTMAARADGRVEHIPTRQPWWDRCISWLTGNELPEGDRRGKMRAGARELERKRRASGAQRRKN